MLNDNATFCPHCHYPMLKLSRFEGVSSRDAQGFNGKDSHDFSFWGWWAIAHDLFTRMWSGVGTWLRRRQVNKLRAEVLPQFPKSLICPHCMQVFRKA
jgi:hypothetical protein